MSQVVSLPADAAGAPGFDSELEPNQGESGAFLTTDIVASELLVQLGHEYFAFDRDPVTSGANETRAQNTRATISPQALANASPAPSGERDFWEDVATTSEKAAQLPPSYLGKPLDPVAYAIATVSASYTLPVSDKRGPNTTTPAATHPSRSPAAQSRDSSTEVTGKHAQHATSETPDLLDALASLLGFEEIAGLDGLGELDPTTFSRARELAAHALAAAATNRNSALKAAEGRKG